MINKVTVEMMPIVLATGDPARVDEPIPAKFKEGDKVIVLEVNAPTHNRLPSYIKGKVGTVTFDHGVFVFPDTSAHRKGPKPQHVYTVTFTAQEVWGEAGHPSDRLYADIWDDYMRHA
ncbi:MAG: nitrile hydratase subunit beta [Rhodospirillum sp.]|nr:nitrile hydratase subunit beta [Rhodospirillum sp.]MCF8491426.1 nitrile hydratase subunit beta [Rhodospirillum sp.]MCF8500947.1 nitrile hydratase subunit beta [Rhodospirillum sp.]